MNTSKGFFDQRENQLVFDEQLRLQLRSHRQSLGLSYSALGRFLRLHGSTIQKWESGIIRQCSLHSRERLIHFLHGDYDDDIRAKLGDPRRGAYLCPVSASAIECVKHLANCYHLLESRPDLRSLLLEAAMKAANDALRTLAHGCQRH